MSYSSTLKNSVLSMLTIYGCRVSDVAKDCCISKSTLYRWLKTKREEAVSGKDKFIVKNLEERLRIQSEDRDALIKVVAILSRELDIQGGSVDLKAQRK